MACTSLFPSLALSSIPNTIFFEAVEKISTISVQIYRLLGSLKAVLHLKKVWIATSVLTLYACSVVREHA